MFNSSQGSQHRDEIGTQTWWREGIIQNTWGIGILPAGMDSESEVGFICDKQNTKKFA